MRLRDLSFALFLAVTIDARPAEEPRVVLEHDHLVPVNPYWGDWHDRYTKELQSLLKLDSNSYFFAQMVVRPSFSGEYAIRLHGAKGDTNIEETEKLFLTYSAASTNIFYAMAENNEKNKQQKVTIAHTTFELPKPLATRIYELWSRMLLRTRFPEGSKEAGDDGTTYEFGIWCRYGETWSPQERKSPLLFVELGESLISYCKATSAERPAAAKEIETRAAELETYLTAHPSK